MRFTPECIRTLGDGEIFVFGSNTDGRHGKGAALTALRKFGARNGVGEGLRGRSYALPTVGRRLSKLPLWAIRGYVGRFLKFAALHPEYKFLVTQVGCGLAGHKVRDIAPMFENVTKNCVLPESFVEFNKERHAFNAALICQSPPS